MQKSSKKISRVPAFPVFVKALFPGFMLGCLHLIFSYSGFYLNSGWDWIDIPLHLIGGACVAFAIITFIADAIKTKKLSPLPWYFFILCVIGCVALVGIVWEFYEFAFDIIFPSILRQPSNADTMKDLANDLNGGFIMVLILKRQFGNILARNRNQ